MQQKEITIKGKQYPVVFDMQTMMNFEEISNKSFFQANHQTINNQVALIAAAVISADKNTTLSVEDIIGKKSLDDVQEILAASSIINKLANKFFNIPEIEKKNNPEPEQTEEEGEDKPKN